MALNASSPMISAHDSSEVSDDTETGVDTSDVSQLLSHLDTVPSKDFYYIKNALYECLNEHAECLQSLVYYYLTVNSQRALEIIVGVREPHDRILFDILVDCLKRVEYRSKSLTLIINIIHKKPVSLPKIINNHKILQCFTNILKTDQDVLTLVRSIWVLVELISTLPSIIIVCLPDIFECFSRLCFWLSKENGNNTSEFSTINLHIWVYRLFHKLYGMYPCNFLAYLRSTYGNTHRDSNRENLSVFNEIIEPFLKSVRLHPLLVTAAKETELSPSRWKKMETHDIIIECSKLVLDPIEGIQEECDFCADYHTCCSMASSCNTKSTFAKETLESLKRIDNDSLIGQANQELRASVEPYSIESLFMGQKNKNEYDIQMFDQQSSSGTPVIQQTSIETFDSAHEAVVGTAHDANIVASQLCQPMVGNYFESQESQNLTSIVSTDFVHHSNNDEDDDKEVCEINSNAYNSNVLYPIRDSTPGGPMTPFISTTCVLTEVTRNTEVLIDTTSSDGPIHGDQKEETSDSPETVNHDECLEIFFKKSFKHANSRLRYQSQCVPDSESPNNYLDVTETRPPKIKRSNSCPQLTVKAQQLDTSENNSNVNASNATPIVLIEESFKSNNLKIPIEISDSKNNSNDDERTNYFHSNLNFSRPSIPSNKGSCHCLGYVNFEGAQTQCECMGSQKVPLCHVLHHSNLRESQSQRNVKSKLEHQLSSVEILDRHLMLGSEMCIKEINANYPLTSTRDTDWTHFGEPPPPDEINILRTHIALLHAQLLFERQQREIHSTRNRRLLKKAKKCESREEEFNAQRDQLLLQEKEIETLMNEIAFWREKCNEIKEKFINDINCLNDAIKRRDLLCKDLEIEKRELLDDINTIKEKTNHLHREFENLQSKNLRMEEEFKFNDVKMAQITELKNKNSNLKRQVLLLSELYQNVREQYAFLKKDVPKDEVLLMDYENLKYELQNMQNKLETSTIQMENFKGKCSELENHLMKKDAIIADQRRKIDSFNAFHKSQLKIEKERIEELHKICRRQEQHMLTLYGQLGMKEHEQRLRDLRPAASVSSAVSDSDSDVSTSPNSNHTFVSEHEAESDFHNNHHNGSENSFYPFSDENHMRDD